MDAARCFKELGQEDDTVCVLSEAMDAFGKSASPEFLEQAGDLVLESEGKPAQALAARAYQMAIEALRETVSQSKLQTGENPLQQ